MIRSGGDYTLAVKNVRASCPKLSRLMSELRGSVSELSQHPIIKDAKTVKVSYASARFEHELQGIISMMDKITTVNKALKQILPPRRRRQTSDVAGLRWAACAVTRSRQRRHGRHGRGSF